MAFTPGGSKSKTDVSVQGKLIRLRDIATFTAVSSAGGQTATLPFDKRASIVLIHVIQVGASTATDFSVEIYSGSTLLPVDLVYGRNNATDTIPAIQINEGFDGLPFWNEDGLDELYLRIIPDAGVTNEYHVKVFGYLES